MCVCVRVCVCGGGGPSSFRSFFLPAPRTTTTTTHKHKHIHTHKQTHTHTLTQTHTHTSPESYPSSSLNEAHPHYPLHAHACWRSRLLRPLQLRTRHAMPLMACLPQTTDFLLNLATSYRCHCRCPLRVFLLAHLLASLESACGRVQSW